MTLDYKRLANALPLVKEKRGIHKAWELYAQSLPFLKLSDWQQDDINGFIDKGQVCWNYCREGGKSEKGSYLCVFGMLCGIETMWLAATTKQLLAAQKHWKKNPYVSPFKPSNTRNFIELITGDRIESVCATEDNVRGPHVEWVFYDEVSLMDNEIYTSSLPIANGDIHRLYMSTPVYGSVFHSLSEKIPTYTHNYLECLWKSPEQIKDIETIQRDMMGDNKWRQEYMCEFLLLEGAVFHNISVTYEAFPDCIRIRQGIDFGGSKPHTLVRIGEYHGKIYALGEWAFDPANPEDESKITAMSELYPTEAESNGPGIMKLPLVPKATAVFWDANTKYEQLGYLLRRQIIMNPNITPNLYDDCMKAEYHSTPKGEQKVETGKLDYLAAFIHAGGDGHFTIVDIPQEQQYGRRRSIR